MENDSYYVGLSDPITIKKELLEISKDVLLCLQSFEKIKIQNLRLDSEKKLMENKVKEIIGILTKIKSYLPTKQRETIEKELDLIENEIGNL